LRCAAALAAAAARAEVIAAYDAATVLVTLTSQVALRPSRNGIDVNLSGRFPSDLVNPCGSLMDGMPALVNERQIKSFVFIIIVIIIIVDFRQRMSVA